MKRNTPKRNLHMQEMQELWTLHSTQQYHYCKYMVFYWHGILT